MEPTSPTVWPNHSYYTEVWELERSLDLGAWIQWMESSGSTAIYFTAFYLVGIYWGQVVMSQRAPCRLKGPLMLWNAVLAVFSLLGAVRTVPGLLHTFKENGIHAGICGRYEHTVVTTFWSLLFTWSKVPELGDTAFIILKKRPLIFLHWYHHITVLVYTWLTYPAFNSNGTTFMAMNFLVHTVMYAYYVLKLGGFPVRKAVSISVTILQILQMILGVFVNIYGLVASGMGLTCFVHQSHIYFCLGMYLSYLVLFANFFAKAYLSPKEGPKTE